MHGIILFGIILNIIFTLVFQQDLDYGRWKRMIIKQKKKAE